MKIAVIGTGGVGGFFGGKLLHQGHEVYFLARNQHLKAIQEKGLEIKSVDGDFHLNEVNAFDDIKEFPKVDLVMVCTKAEQVQQVAPQLHTLLGEETMVLPLQNGLASEEILEQYIDKQHIIPGLCKIYSKIEAPGIIHHFGWHRPVIHFGEYNGEMSQRILLLDKTFSDAGLDARPEKDIWQEKWKKFMFICSGGLLALTRSTYGEIRNHPTGKEMLQRLFMEIYEVGCAKKIKWDKHVVDNAMQIVNNSEYDATASMQRDIDAKKPSELSFLNGTVVKYAKALNIEVPVNQMIYDCLMVSEFYARKENK